MLELSDRIGVMFRGRLVEVLDGRTADREEIGLLMATGGRESGIQAPIVEEASCTAIGPLLRRVRDVALLPTIAILLALVFGAILMILSSPLVKGFDLTLPITSYKALVVGAFGSTTGARQHRGQRGADRPCRPRRGHRLQGGPVEKTGFRSPTRPHGNVSDDEVDSKRADYRRAEGACLEARGYSVKLSARRAHARRLCCNCR